MNTFALELWDDEATGCRFYTVRWDDAELNETDKFFKKVGLPNKGKVTVGEVVFLYPNFPLRLYALRISNRPDLVVLFNGGVKSAQTNQMSKDLYLKWMEACRFARRIEEAIRNKEIGIDNRGRIIAAVGGDEIYL